MRQSNAWSIISLTILAMVCSIAPAAAQAADSYTSQEGRFVVCREARYGFIGRDGKTILKPTYWKISDFHEGLATFQQGDKVGVINKLGKVQVKACFEEIGPFANGKALARAYSPRKQYPDGDWACAGLWGLIDTHGNWLVKPTYDYVNALDKEYNLAAKGGKRGFVDRNLKVLVALKFDELYDISEGMAAFGEKGKLGFIDQNGNVIVTAKYTSAAPFREGVARVQNADGWGFIDKRGKTVINHQYKDANSFSEGAAVVSTFNDADGPFFINHDGSKLFNEKYGFAESFKNGKARVHALNRGKFYRGYIDKLGNFTASDKNEEYETAYMKKPSEGLFIIEEEKKEPDYSFLSTSNYIVKDTKGRVCFKLAKIFRISDFHDGVVVFSRPVLAWKKSATQAAKEEEQEKQEQTRERNKYIANPYGGPMALRRALSKPPQWGYKDATGKIVIPPKFRFAKPFSDGLAVVEEVLLAGYIDKTGKYAIRPCFPIGASSFEHGTAYGTKCSKEYTEKPFTISRGCVGCSCSYRIGLIDRSGKFITQPKYEQFEPISEGRRAFRLDDKWGFMDSSGKVVIEPKYAAVQPFSEGLAAVTEKHWGGGFSYSFPSSWGFVDKDGKLVIPHQYPSAGSFHNGLALVSENYRNILGKPEGFIDKTGKLQLPSEFYLSKGFEGGVAVRGQNKKCWLIDTTGKALTDDSYDQFGTAEGKSWRLSAEGLIPVKRGSLWGFIDTQGNNVIAPQFNEVRHFHEGLAVVKFKHGHLAYIDPQGKIKLDESYEHAWQFQDGLAVVVNDQGTYVIDKSGKHLFDATGIESYSEGIFLWKDTSKEPIKYCYSYQYN
ncbi:MAG: WG repeat-containing protein [Candidatus Obscuribacterales bacterium]